MAASDTSSDDAHYEYYALNDKEKATFSQSELSMMRGVSIFGSDVEAGWCRFEVLGAAITPEMENSISFKIHSLIAEKFPFTRNMHPVTYHHYDSPGRTFADVKMNDIVASRWTPDTHFELPGGQLLRYHSKKISAHYLLMSLDIPADIVATVDIVSCILQVALRNAAIEDVWIKDSSPGSDVFRDLRMATGTIHFVVGVYEMKELLHDFEPIEYEEDTGEEVTRYCAYAPDLDPVSSTKLQPGWIVLPSGRDVKVSYRNRAGWCNKCRSNALIPHYEINCPQYIIRCHDCGGPGHSSGFVFCLKQRKPVAAIQSSSSPVSFNPYRSLPRQLQSRTPTFTFGSSSSTVAD